MSTHSTLKSIGLPTISGLLYGFSWPIFEGLNLSFLAWFAFCPLLLFIEQSQKSFIRAFLGSLWAMTVFALMSAGWLFFFPQNKWEITIIVLIVIFCFKIPFDILHVISRQIGFDRALWLLPFFWAFWEWAYLHLDFAMGTHLSPYSQSSNIWLIQYIDITGMWGISFWLMLFNVLIYKSYKASLGTGGLNKKRMASKLVLPIVLMLGLPLLYAVFSYAKYDNPKEGASVAVSLFPTQYDAQFLSVDSNKVGAVNELLYRSDSLFYHRNDIGLHSDLYLWPETGSPYQIGASNLGWLLRDAVNDWGGALLTGCKGVSISHADSSQSTHVSGVLLSSYDSLPQYHHKTYLTPGQEHIPYLSAFRSMGLLTDSSWTQNYFSAGVAHQPLPFTTRRGEQFKVGVSLCFEQWYPDHWAKLAQNGTDFYAHLAGEGWYGEIGFQQFMANVSRLRCIETRRQAARCANVGLSLFINERGEFSRKAKGAVAVNSRLYAKGGLTFFAQNPYWFQWTALAVCLALYLHSLYPFLLAVKSSGKEILKKVAV